jgi:hypothetical protein
MTTAPAGGHNTILKKRNNCITEVGTNLLKKCLKTANLDLQYSLKLKKHPKFMTLSD